ncbi:zf-HC2 domain-containing protein [Streptomyces sp. NPDC048109]
MRAGEDSHFDIGAYVLHALPPDEEAFFDNHLANCATCRREAEALNETAVLLGEVTPRSPSARARRWVMEQVALSPVIGVEASGASEGC